MKPAIASVVAVAAGLPAAIWRVAARIQPRSLASAAVAARTSLAAPVTAEALAAYRFATASAAARKRAFSFSRSCSGMIRSSGTSSGGLRAQAAGAWAMRHYPVPRSSSAVVIFGLLGSRVDNHMINTTRRLSRLAFPHKTM